MPRRRGAPADFDLEVAGALEQWCANAPMGVAIVDRQNRIRLANPALAAIDGVPVEEHAGRTLEDVLPDSASSLGPIVRRVLETGEPIQGQEVIPPASADIDRPRRRVATAFPLRADDGSVQAAALVLAEPPDDDESTAALRARAERLELAMEGTGTGFWEWDIAEDRMYWSRSLGPLHGLAHGESPAGYNAYLELIHREDRPAVNAEIQRTLERCEHYGQEFRVVHPDGTERWHASRGHLILDERGRPSALVGLTADVTERRRREDAARFLAEAGNALASSLDPLQTMEEIARLAVPRLADWCAVQLAAEFRGSYENIAVAHVDPDKVRWARELQERYPPDPDAPTGAPQVIRSGRSELYPEIDDELLQASARDEQQLELIRQLRIRSAMVVPMRARDRTLGAITFIFAESGRQYSTDELELAEELGHRAGLALDHARLYDREHRTAETLQRALLPLTLAAIRGHELAARYLPGRAGDHVGGDWYDAFPLLDGRIGIAIGDIGGHGIAAAALMGQVRNALRAYALKANGPGAALRDLRALDDQLEELVFATLTYIVYDPRTGEGLMANAGHLPPLIVHADGGGGFVDAPLGPPLGTGADAESPEHSFAVPPGATLVLYTDGLVESRTRDLETGLDRLAAMARANAADVNVLADEILDAIPDERQDDIALLALRRHSG